MKKMNKNQAKGKEVKEKQSKAQIQDQVRRTEGVRGSRDLQGPRRTETNV